MKHVLPKYRSLMLGIMGNKNYKNFYRVYQDNFDSIAIKMTEILGEIKDEKVEELKKAIQSGDASRENSLKKEIEVLESGISQAQRIDYVMGDYDLFDTDDKEGSAEIGKALETFAGQLLRIANAELLRPFMNEISKKWDASVAEVLEIDHELDSKTARSFAEYFTGKKNVPNFDKQSATAKKFLANGITGEDFESIALKASDNLSKIFNDTFARGGKARAKMSAVLDGKTNAKLRKLFDHAIDDYISTVAQSEAYRSVKRELSESDQSELSDIIGEML
tara:strand:- start:71 stop:907 length:837 start_codon:yes stop_codon:yes gene_type:complete